MSWMSWSLRQTSREEKSKFQQKTLKANSQTRQPWERFIVLFPDFMSIYLRIKLTWRRLRDGLKDTHQGIHMHMLLNNTTVQWQQTNETYQVKTATTLLPTTISLFKIRTHFCIVLLTIHLLWFLVKKCYCSSDLLTLPEF